MSILRELIDKRAVQSFRVKDPIETQRGFIFAPLAIKATRRRLVRIINSLSKKCQEILFPVGRLEKGNLRKDLKTKSEDF